MLFINWRVVGNIYQLTPLCFISQLRRTHQLLVYSQARPGGFTQTTTKEGGRFVFMVIRSVFCAEIPNLEQPFHLYRLFYYICEVLP